ncbi:MAG: hypothetical protein ABL914_08795 [Novosphingobium sp.]|uniref:hypothetical protein n=1 Tax=Novosphingobium sp. TaxID=1874826 RepID=UPI0032B9F814
MWLYLLAFSFPLGLAWWFYFNRQKRLDADPGQHQLAALLIAAANGQDGATRRDVTAHLAALAKGQTQRRVRLTHAVLMIRSEAAPDLYERVLKLSRGL